MIVSHPGWPGNIWCQRGGILPLYQPEVSWVNSRCWKFIYELQTMNYWTYAFQSHMVRVHKNWNPYNEIQVWDSLQTLCLRKEHKKNIIHIRLSRLTWWLTMDIRISKSTGEHTQKMIPIEIPKVSSLWNFKTNWMSIPTENSQSLFPLKQRKNFLENLLKTELLVKLVLTNQQTNEHLNKTHWDWFKFFNSYNLYTM